LEQVTVTGSRIPESSLTPFAPVIVLGPADLERPGLDSIGKVLQQLPAVTGSPLNTNVNNSGDGSTRIDLRGLNPKRTLILLNGRRLPNGGVGADSSVDIDSIPFSMIERIDVLTSAATAVYGADAVAGVVNLITRNHLDGPSVRAYGSVADGGDGAIGQLQATFGAGSEETAVGMVGVDYTRQTGVSLDRRAYSAIPQVILNASGAVGYAGSFTTPDGLFTVPTGNRLGLPPNDYFRIPGAVGQSAAAYKPVTLAGTFNYAPYNWLQTPNTRTSAWLQGSVHLDRETEIFVEGLWHSRTSSQQLAPTPYDSYDDGGPILPDGSTGIPASNYYNPFGVDLPYGGRRFAEINDRRYEEIVRGWRTVLGVRGKWGSWHWQLAGAYATSDATTHENGAIADDRLFAGLGPSGPDASGRIVCGARGPGGIVPPANIIPGCVPINLFNGVGTVTPQQTAYISFPLTDQGLNSQRLLNLDLQGDWLKLPAGSIAWATGFEYRKESGHYVYDPLRLAGVAGSPPSVQVPGGSITARDVYLEMRIPLLRDRPAAHSLDLDLGARYADYSTFGGRTAWQGTLRWQPNTPLALHVDYATVFRAPTLNESFQTRAAVLGPGAYDPCGNTPNPTQQASCAAHGVPGGSYVQSPTDQFITTTGGNPQLAPEHGNSFNSGIDLLVGRQRLTLDYFHTYLEGFISAPGPDQVLADCANHIASPACAQIVRKPDGTVHSVTAVQQNFGSATVSGVDMGWSSDFPFRAGTFGLGALATYLAQHDYEVFAGGDVARLAGSFTSGFQAYPRWRALAHADWQRGPWRLSYQIQLIGSYSNCTYGYVDNNPVCQRISGVLYHDITAGFSFRSGIDLRLGVLNFTNRDPPFVSGWQDNTDPATYPLLGRTFFADLRASFR
jgi:outer membrane receptor protein involved in Fe transport